MKALPAVARRVSSNPESYVYLAESIQAWPDQQGLATADRPRRLALGRVAQPHRGDRGAAPGDPVTRRLVLLGGSAGTGKTTLARALAAELGAGWLQLDSLWLAMKAGAGEGTAAYDLLDIDGRMGRDDESDEDVLAGHIRAAEKVCSVLPTVLPLELQAHEALVVDGAWLVPSFVAGLSLPDCEISAVYVTHTDESGVAETLASRLGGRSPEERHLRDEPPDPPVRRLADRAGARSRPPGRRGSPVRHPEQPGEVRTAPLNDPTLTSPADANVGSFAARAE